MFVLYKEISFGVFSSPSLFSFQLWFCFGQWVRMNSEGSVLEITKFVSTLGMKSFASAVFARHDKLD